MVELARRLGTDPSNLRKSSGIQIFPTAVKQMQEGEEYVLDP